MINEQSLRNWAKGRFAHSYWVNPSLGSTVGLPDLHCQGAGGRSLWLELKVADLSRSAFRYEVRPEQRRILKEMDSLGCLCGVLLAVKLTGKVFLVAPKGPALAGSIPFDSQFKDEFMRPMGGIGPIAAAWDDPTGDLFKLVWSLLQRWNGQRVSAEKQKNGVFSQG